MLLDEIKKWCEENETSIAELEKNAGLGNGTISGWVENTPSVQSLYKIHRTTGIEMTKLVDLATKDCEEKVGYVSEE